MDPILESTETIAIVSHPRMSWGAVIAGWAVAVGIASLFYLMGLAVGFSAFDPQQAATTAKGMGVGTAVWMILTWVVSLFLGSMFASWFDGKNDSTMGTMHGVTVWGLSVVMSGLLLSAGLGRVVHGAALVGDHVGVTQQNSQEAGAHAMPGTPAADAAADVQAKLELGAQSTGVRTNATAENNHVDNGSSSVIGTRGDREAMTAAAGALMSSHTQTATDILLANTTLTPSQIDAAVANASPRVEKYQLETQALATQVKKYTSAALWVVFLSTLLGMLAAALGGCLGASHIHRVYHLRTYEPVARSNARSAG